MKHRITLGAWIAAGTLAFALPGSISGVAAPAAFKEDFSQREPGPVPDEYIEVAGQAASVREVDGNRFLEIPEAPSEPYGLMFGPAHREDWGAQARFFGTRRGRTFPAFGVSLNTIGGYRVQVSPAKKAIEIYKGDLTMASAPYDWESDTWTQVRVQIRKTGEDVWTISGKAWKDGNPEPDDWTIEWVETESPISGRAIVWGMPYSGRPIRVDDLKILPLDK